MSGHDIDMTIPVEIWSSDWSANTKIVFGYLWTRQGKNGCAWPFQDTTAADLKKPNLRTIQTSIANLEASGHLRKLASRLPSRVAYQVRRSPEHEWPGITSDAARAPDNVLWMMLAVIMLGAVLLFPALGYLFVLFKSDR